MEGIVDNWHPVSPYWSVVTIIHSTAVLRYNVIQGTGDFTFVMNEGRRNQWD
jgi:hypothetical protein